MAKSTIADRYLKTLETNSLENKPKSPPRSINSLSPSKEKSCQRSSQILASPKKLLPSVENLKPRETQTPYTDAVSIPNSKGQALKSKSKNQSSHNKTSTHLSNSSINDIAKSPTQSGHKPSLGPKPDRNPLMHNQELTPSQVSWDLERKNWQAYEYLCHVVEAKEWMEKIIGEKLPPCEEFPESLQNGIALAKTVQKLRPNLMKWPIFEHKRLQYRHTENITLFFDLLQVLHIPQLFQFDMTDLYEKRNLPKVIYCIHAMSHFIADAESTVSAVDDLVGKLEFSEDQLNSTEKGLAGHSIPNFGAMTRQLSGKHSKLDFDPEDESIMDADCLSFASRDLDVSVDSFRTEASDEEDSMLDFKPPRRYKAKRDFSVDSLSSLRIASRDMYDQRYSQYDRQQYRGYGYRNLSSRTSLRSHLLSSAELMLIELEELDPETIILQGLCRGSLLRRRLQNAALDQDVLKSVESLQAICRGALTRKRSRQDMIKLSSDQEASLVLLQSILRAKHICRIFRTTTTKVNDIATFQGLARGVLVRRELQSLRNQLQRGDCQKHVTALQSCFRGTMIRFRLGCLYDDLDLSISDIVRLQAVAKSALVYRRCQNLRKNWTENVDKIVTLQSVWRAKAQGARYRILIADNNPTLEAIKPFLHLIDDKPEDSERELELESIIRDIGQKVRQNEHLESLINQIDMKVALLTTNEINIDELVLQQQRLDRENKNGPFTDIKSLHGMNGGKLIKRSQEPDTGLRDQFDPNSLRKPSRDRIELYQGLFYVLQTMPKYLTSIMTIKAPKSLNVAELILASFGGAKTTRENFFLLKLLAYSILRSTVGSPQNTVAWSIILQLNKRKEASKIARIILSPATEKLKACYDQLLEYDPHIIYEHLTGGADLNAEEAIRDPAVRTVFVQNLQRLREITASIVQALATYTKDLPYHIKFLAREVYRQVMRVKRDQEEAMSSVGQVIISQFIQPALLAADSLDLVDMAAGNTSKNILLTSRIIHQIGLMTPFSSSGSTDAYLQPLNEFVKSSAHHLSLRFQRDILECEDLSTHFAYSEYDDITLHERPILNISTDHVLAIHYMSFHNLSSLVDEKDDVMKPILDKLGPLPRDARDMLDLARFTELTLELNPRYGSKSLSTDADGSSSLLATTKRCLGYVLRVQSNQPDLMSVLVAPVELEHEHSYNNLLDSENTRLAAGELGNLSFRELKLLTLEKVLELESSGIVSREDGYQTLVNAIAEDIRSKDALRHSKALNIESKKSTVRGLEEKHKFLEQRLAFYNQQIDKALKTLQTRTHQANVAKSKRGFQRFQLPSSKSHTGAGSEKSNPKYGQYRTTADKLYERGILIRLRGYSERQRKDVCITFSSDKVACFQLEICYKGILVPKGTMEITLDDLLSYQYQNQSNFNLMEGELQFSTNRFLRLILHRFFGKT